MMLRFSLLKIMENNRASHLDAAAYVFRAGGIEKVLSHKGPAEYSLC